MRKREDHRGPERPRRQRSSYDEATDTTSSRADARRRRSSAEDGRRGTKPRRLPDVFAPFEGLAPRLLFVFCLIAVACLPVVFMLFKYQIVKGPQYAAEAAANRTNEIVVPAKRGTIYDRNGNVLAMSVDVKTVYANPKAIEKKDDAASILSDVLGGSKQDYAKIVGQDTTFAYIKKKVDTTTADALAQKLKDADIDGIYFLDETKRVYPYGAVAGQVLGMVGADGHGLTGLELYYDDVLAGKDGSLEMEVGAGGTPIAGGSSKSTKAMPGSDIVISLDVDIQSKVEKVLVEGAKKYDAASSSAMVTNPKTGEILATASTPLADLTDPAELTNEALNLRMVSDNYEPGSIFKIITMDAGLKSGAFSPDTDFSVPVRIKVGDDYVTDSIPRDHTQEMSVRTILERSSNTGTILMARKAGAEQFANTVSELGIGSVTGIDYPGETAGIVPQYADYSSMTLSIMAFGQGLAFPQVQMVQAVGAIANGGSLLTPHFLIEKAGQRVDWGSKATVCTPEIASQVTSVLQSVITDGTAIHGAVDGYKVAAKTGTAQMSDHSTGYVQGRYISSLIGYANDEDPDVLVYVGLNGTPQFAESSSAYMFSSIMGEALKDMGVKPVS